MKRRSDSEYIELGRTYIRSILEREHAATWAEIEARSSERDGTTRVMVDVNHMLTARERMLEDGDLSFIPGTRTRGGREVAVYHLPFDRNTRAVEDAAGRKRLLQGRWEGWAVGNTRYPKGLVGPAGDRVLAATLKHDDLRRLYLPIEVGGGEVRTLYGSPIEGGALDGAAVLVGRSGGVIQRPVTLLIEMKNLRHWLFPKDHEVYQVLDKAARFSAAHPEAVVVPTLVCRRRHITTFRMAQDLGLLVIEVHRQFLLPVSGAPPRRVEEVRSGLGFYFLHRSVEPDPILLEVFRRTIPERVEAARTRWEQTAPVLGPFFRALRDESLTPPARLALVQELRGAAAEVPGARGGW